MCQEPGRGGPGVVRVAYVARARTEDFPIGRKTSRAPDRPEIVCICGSTRFVNEMVAANRDLTFAGAIVVAPAVLPRAVGHESDALITNEQKAALDAPHLRKIDVADRVLVVNPGGYNGESTNRETEIAYARAVGKPVSYTDGARSASLSGSQGAAKRH